MSLKLHSYTDVYSYSCLHPLSNERKSMFKSGDSRAVWTWVWTWKYLKWAMHYLYDVIYGKRRRPDLMLKRRFQRGLCWNQVKYARITITHVCFIALTLAGSLGPCFCSRRRCVRLWRRYDVRKYTADVTAFGLVFKQHSHDPANVNAWKNMCDPYIYCLGMY